MPPGAKKRKAAKRKKELAIHPDSPQPTLPPQGGNDGGDGVERENGGDDLLNGRNGNESGPEMTSPRTEDGDGDHNYNHHTSKAEEEPVKAIEEKRAEEDRESTESSGAMDRSDHGSSREEAASESYLVSKDDKPKEEEITPLPISAAVSVADPEVVCIVHVPSSETEMESKQQPAAGGSSDLPISEEEVEVSEVLVVSASEVVVQVDDATVEDVHVQRVVEVEPPSHRAEEKVVSQMDAAHEFHDSAESCPGTVSREIKGSTEVVLSTQAEHRASWMSCCGLFDAIMSSGR